MDENFTEIITPEAPQVPVEAPVPEQGPYEPDFAPQAPEYMPEEPQEEVAPPKPKKKLNKKILLAGIAAVAVIALVIVLVSVLGGGPKSTAVFIKDGEVCLYIEGMKEPIQLSSRLGKEARSTEEFLSMQIDEFAFYVAVCDGGKRVFYPDKFAGQNEGVTLYYRNANKPEEDPVKIDNKVYSWHVSPDGKQVLYVQHDNNSFSLHLYDVKSEEETRLAKDIRFPDSNIVWADDLSTICYLSDEDVYLWTPETEEVKVAKHASFFRYIPETNTLFVKTSDGELLVKTAEMEECEEAADKVSKLLAYYPSGEAYFLRESSVERCLLDYLDDDMKAEDEAMSQPKKPNYPTAPQRVYSWNYATDEEYQAAKAQYDIDYAAYLEKYNAMKEEYNNALELYGLKEERDAIRESLKERVMEYEEYALYYFDGSEEHLLADSLVTDSLKVRSSDASVLVYNAYTPAELVKPKLSEIENKWDAPYMVQQAIEDALYTDSEFYLTIGSETTVIDHTDASNFIISSDGSVVYFLDAPFIAYDKENGAYADAPAAEAPVAEAPAATEPDKTEEDADALIPENQREYASLYRISIADGQAGEPELVDSGVSIKYAPHVGKDASQLVYAKEVDAEDRCGELYVAGQLISDEADLGDLGVLPFLDDYILFSIDSHTLCMRKLGDENAEVIEIADDVHNIAITENGDLLYLQDYSQKRWEGTLYLYDMSRGKAKEIADDVTCLGYPR